MERLRNFINKLVMAFFRILTSIVLYILPVRSSYLFLEIATTTFLVRTIKCNPDIDMVKFFRLINNNYTDGDIGLPAYSSGLIWDSEFLDSEKVFSTGTSTMREVIKDKELLKANLDRVVDSMLVNLPFLMRNRMGINSEIGRGSIRRELVSYLMRKLYSPAF